MAAIRYVRGTLPGIPGEHEIAVLEGDTHIGRWIEESRRLDHDQNALPRIGRLIGPESVVWDVGAFVGDHTAYYASKARRVLAFEVAADARTCLIENVRLYGNVEIWLTPVGDGVKVVATDGPEQANMGARSLTFSRGRGAIRTLRLDDVASLPPSLIKLDIEGMEISALRGANLTLREHHPIIVCEVNRLALERAGTSPAELHAVLTGHGYKMRDLFTEQPWHPDDERPQFDVVAKVEQ